MKARWPRQQPIVELDKAGAARLLRPFIADADVTEITALDGGLVNSNLRVRLSGRDAPLLLRLYQRAPPPHRKEAAIAGLLRGKLPIAAFHHVADDNPVTGHPYAIVEWIEGTRFDSLLSELDRDALVGLGEEIGRALADLHGIIFERYGFFEDGLQIPTAIDLDHRGILAFLRSCLSDGPAAERLGADLARELEAAFARQGAAINDWLPQACLVHGDFNPANLLLRRHAESQVWRLAAILDWEFALSATPGFDFGNLLRPPLGRCPDFAEALAAGYRAGGGWLPDDWRRIARLVDLTAWAEMLARPTIGDAVIEDARRIVRATLAEEARPTPPRSGTGRRARSE